MTPPVGLRLTAGRRRRRNDTECGWLIGTPLSSPRKREPIVLHTQPLEYWVPAFAGTTKRENGVRGLECLTWMLMS